MEISDNAILSQQQIAKVCSIFDKFHTPYTGTDETYARATMDQIRDWHTKITTALVYADLSQPFKIDEDIANKIKSIDAALYTKPLFKYLLHIGSKEQSFDNVIVVQIKHFYATILQYVLYEHDVDVANALHMFLTNKDAFVKFANGKYKSAVNTYVNATYGIKLGRYKAFPGMKQFNAIVASICSTVKALNPVLMNTDIFVFDKGDMFSTMQLKALEELAKSFGLTLDIENATAFTSSMHAFKYVNANGKYVYHGNKYKKRIQTINAAAIELQKCKESVTYFAEYYLLIDGKKPSKFFLKRLKQFEKNRKQKRKRC